MIKTYEKYIDEYKEDIVKNYFYGKNDLLNKLYGFEDRGEFTIQVLDELLDLQKENQQLKEKLNCKEYFSSTMPEDTEFVILTKNNYDRQQKDLALENIQLKKQKDDVVVYIKEAMYSDSFTELPSGEITDIGYCIPAFEDILRMLGEIE